MPLLEEAKLQLTSRERPFGVNQMERIGNSPMAFEFTFLAAVTPSLLSLHNCWCAARETKQMSSAEIATEVIGQTIEEIKQGIDSLIDSTKLPIEAAAFDLQENAQRAVDQMKDAMTAAVDAVVQSGSADQMRGYANEAMGKTKLAVALATQSPELALAGIAQKALGEVQKFVGEAKLAADSDD